MLAKVRKLQALRQRRAQLKADAAAAWAAFYRAVDAAEGGTPDPVTGGFRPEVQARLDDLRAWAEAVEAEYREVYGAEQVLAGEILGIEELGMANEELGEVGEVRALGEVREVRVLGDGVPMVAQAEAV